MTLLGNSLHLLRPVEAADDIDGVCCLEVLPMGVTVMASKSELSENTKGMKMKSTNGKECVLDKRNRHCRKKISSNILYRV